MGVMDGAAAVEQAEAAAMHARWWARVEADVADHCARVRAASQERIERGQERDASRGLADGTVFRHRRPFSVPRLVGALPGFAELWKVKVPAEAVERSSEGWTVACRCGASVAVVLGDVVFCPGDCGRWFLRTEVDVRVKVWPQEQAA